MRPDGVLGGSQHCLTLQSPQDIEITYYMPPLSNLLLNFIYGLYQH